jgi:hypothetical protein
MEKPTSFYDANEMRQPQVSMIWKDAEIGHLKDFQTLYLTTNSLYIDAVDSELKLKLLLLTEAYKVKRVNAGQLHCLRQILESILAYVEVFQIKNFAVFVSRIKDLET